MKYVVFFLALFLMGCESLSICADGPSTTVGYDHTGLCEYAVTGWSRCEATSVPNLVSLGEAACEKQLAGKCASTWHVRVDGMTVVVGRCQMGLVLEE